MSSDTPPPEQAEDEESGFFKVVKDNGLTPGNDRSVVLSCGHSILVSVPHYTDGGPPDSWVGGMEFCYQCDDDSSKGEGN